MGLMGAKSDQLRVSFQGERGAFSEEAVFVLLGNGAEPCPCPTFESAFAALEKAEVDYALVPLENTLAGSIHRTYDLLLDSKFHIVGEVIIPVVHNLIGCPGATLENVKIVQSHPVALFQCLQFFEKHPRIQRKTAEDTAGSVREVIESARRVTGHTIPTQLHPRRAGDPAVLVASSEKAIRELGWKPRYVQLDEILRTAWDWHQKRYA